MKRLFASFILLLSITVTYAKDEPATLSADGPYIFYNEDGTARIVTVDVDGCVSDTTVAAPVPGDVITVTEHSGRWTFDVTLRECSRPDWKRSLSSKVFITSDPHGRLDCFVDLLMRGGVIDNELHWAYGDGQLMVIGDICDRGEDVTQLYWLMYQLEAEADMAGGHAGFVYGNHETMILANDIRYVKEKYKMLAEQIGSSIPEMYGPTTEIGRWLATRNTIEVWGDRLFVHAGLGQDFLDLGLDIPTVNETISKAIFSTREQRKADDLTWFLFRTYGPVWYRGLVLKKEKYKPAEPETVDAVLERFGVSQIVVGHTIFPQVRTFYDGRVLAVNVDNAKNMNSPRGRAAVIKSGKIGIFCNRKVVQK